ncbi:hypothetical protein JCM8097_006557 [Rhodosporidiobolus ruineniae]
MPYFHLPVEDGKLFYELTPAKANPESAPTVLILHPTWSDSTTVRDWFIPGVGSEFFERYNLLTVDLRSCGRSETTPFRGIDNWTQAADLALLLDHLHLPSIHLVTLATVGCPIALCFSILFPSHLASLSVVHFAPIYDLRPSLETYLQLHVQWLQDDDPEAFYEVFEELSFLALGEASIKEEERDWVLNQWVRRYCPARALHVYECTIPILSPTHIAPTLTRQIRTPILALAGGSDLTCSVSVVEDLVADLRTSSSEVEFHVIEGGPCMLGVTHVEEVGPILRAFLEKHAEPASAPSPAAFDFPAALAHLRSLFPSLVPPPSTPLSPRDSRSYSLSSLPNAALDAVWEKCQNLHGKGFSHRDDPHPLLRRPSLAPPLSALPLTGEWQLETAVDGSDLSSYSASAPTSTRNTPPSTPLEEKGEGEEREYPFSTLQRADSSESAVSSMTADSGIESVAEKLEQVKVAA